MLLTHSSKNGSAQVTRKPKQMTLKTFQSLEPSSQLGLLPQTYDWRFRSLKVAAPRNGYNRPQMTPTLNALLTPNFPRYSHDRRQHALETDSDYEIPWTTPQKCQPNSAIRRVESVYTSSPVKYRGSRSDFTSAQPRAGLDATPKASPSTATRVEVRSPLSQRRRIQVLREADTGGQNPRTLEEILRRRNGIYEKEEPLLTGPSRLLQTLKQLKVVEKQQLDQVSQMEQRRITLFDLIAEKESPQKARSPPLIPPRPVQRLPRIKATTEGLENSVPKTIDALKPSALFSSTVPPSLPSPSNGDGASKATVVVKKIMLDDKMKRNSLSPIEDHLQTHPQNQQQYQQITLSSKLKELGQLTSSNEGFISSNSSCVGKKTFDEDSCVTASSSIATPINGHSSSSFSPSSSTISVNSFSPPSMVRQLPDTSLLSQQYCHDPIKDADCVKSKKMKEEVQFDNGPVQVSLVAAPKAAIPVYDSCLIDTSSDTSSSRTSTIFSYPWDLPPPQAAFSYPRHPLPPQVNATSPSVSPEPLPPLKWATLQRHLLQVDTSTPTREQTSGGDAKGSPEEGYSVLPMKGIVESMDEEKMKEKANATINDESRVYEVLLGREPLDERISSPNSKKTTGPLTNSESFPDAPAQPYVYAEVKPSLGVSTSSNTGPLSPPVPPHPSISKDTLLALGIHHYETAQSNWTPDSISLASNPLEHQHPTNRSRVSPSSFGKPGRHLESLVCSLITDQDSPFCKYMLAFIECTTGLLGQASQKTLQNIRQFINGVSNFLQNMHASDLQKAIKAEEMDLRGFQYFEVAQEMELAIESAILQPLHRRLIENLQCNGYGIASPRMTKEFTDLVRERYENSLDLSRGDRKQMEDLLLQPIRGIFHQMQIAFQPSNKLNLLISIFRTIDLYVGASFRATSNGSGDSRLAVKFMVYATAFALADLLKPLTSDGENDNSSISRIEVQRLYLEALLSPARLASSVEGSERLTDLICLLRYVECFHCYTSPAGVIRLLCWQSSKKAMWGPGLHQLRRSYTDSIQETSHTPWDYKIALSPVLPTWQEVKVKNLEKTFISSTTCASPSSSSSILVLAANETKGVLVPFEIPLRQSLTVRELCNVLALKLKIFDPKGFSLFYHTLGGDIPMSDNLHLRNFIMLDSENGSQFFSRSSSISIDFTSNSLPSTTKSSALRRFFQRCKPNSNSDESTVNSSSLLTLHDPIQDNGIGSHHLSIDWTSQDRGNYNFILIYRRRSREVVLYALDLFQHLSNIGNSSECTKL